MHCQLWGVWWGTPHSDPPEQEPHTFLPYIELSSQSLDRCGLRQNTRTCTEKTGTKKCKQSGMHVIIRFIYRWKGLATKCGLSNVKTWNEFAIYRWCQNIKSEYFFGTVNQNVSKSWHLQLQIAFIWVLLIDELTSHIRTVAWNILTWFFFNPRV